MEGNVGKGNGRGSITKTGERDGETRHRVVDDGGRSAPGSRHRDVQVFTQKKSTKDITKGVWAMHEACEIGGRDGPKLSFREVERSTSTTTNHPRHCR